MQEVASQGWQGLRSGRTLDSSRCAIEGVAHNGVLDRTEVNPDLMSAACLDGELQQREACKAFDDFVQSVGNTGASSLRGHTQAINAIASNGTLDFSGRILHSTMHQRQISFDDPTRLKLAREIRVADVVLGHHEQVPRFAYPGGERFQDGPYRRTARDSGNGAAER